MAGAAVIPALDHTRRMAIISRVDMHRTGFSLTELLVVMAIIALLAALGMAGIQIVREQAYGSRCLNNLRQIGMGFEAYGQDNGGVWPVANNATGATGVFSYALFSAMGGSYWYNGIHIYLETPTDAGFSPSLNSFSPVWKCPRSLYNDWTNSAYRIGVDYGFNDAKSSTNVYAITPRDNNRWKGFVSGRVKSGTILLGERWGSTGGNTPGWDPWVRAPWQGVVRYPPKALGLAPAFDNALRVSHRGKSTYVYIDLHVESLRPEEACNPANTSADTSFAPNHWLGVR